MQEEQVTEGTVDADQAIAAVEEKDLAISEYRKKYEKTLTLKKGMTFEIETLKTKEAGMYYTTYSQKFCRSKFKKGYYLSTN